MLWDAAVFLESEADIAEYLAAAFETGELDDVTHALATIARARGSLYKAIGEGANPTLATLFSVLNALNVSLSVKPRAAA